jgi:hypothetical protein
MAQDAAAEWRNVCGAEISFSRQGTTRIEEVSALPGFYGYTYPVDAATGRPTLIQVIVYADERTTIAHEMGHAMGLQHTPTGVMSIHRSPGVHVQPSDCP